MNGVVYQGNLATRYYIEYIWKEELLEGKGSDNTKTPIH